MIAYAVIAYNDWVGEPLRFQFGMAWVYGYEKADAVGLQLIFLAVEVPLRRGLHRMGTSL